MSRPGDYTISHPIRVAATPPTQPAMPPSRQEHALTAEVCPARRADGEPCWLRVHDSRPHLTKDFSWFTLPDPKWTNADLTGDELRDAPPAFKDSQ